MVTEDQILDVLCELADPAVVNQYRGRLLGHFVPNSMPFKYGVQDVACTFRFRRLEPSSRVVFDFHSKNMISRLPKKVILAWLNGSWLDTDESSGKLRLAIRPKENKEDPTPIQMSVYRVVDLQSVDQGDVAQIVAESLELLQKASSGFMNYERMWQKDVMKSSITRGQESHSYDEDDDEDIDLYEREPELDPELERALQELDEEQRLGRVAPDVILRELQELVGLKNVKELIEKLAQQQRIASLRLDNGLEPIELSPHLVFTGNPGTGKTTVANLVGKLYRSLGLLTRGHVVVTGRNELVAQYIGQTAPKTRQMCEKALGGVLFIDEAYALTVDGRDFGDEVITTLLTFMEEHRGQMVVVVAGYSKPMQKFLDCNPGLRSRFDQILHFEDYSAGELVEIFDRLLKKHSYEITESARQEVAVILTKMAQRPNFANAREVRSLFHEMVTEHAASLRGLSRITPRQLKLMTSLSIPKHLRSDQAIELIDMPSIDESDETYG